MSIQTICETPFSGWRHRHSLPGEHLSCGYNPATCRYYIAGQYGLYFWCDTPEELAQLLRDEAHTPWSLRHRAGRTNPQELAAQEAREKREAALAALRSAFS